MNGLTLCREPLVRLVLWEDVDFQSSSVQSSTVAYLCTRCVAMVDEQAS